MNTIVNTTTRAPVDSFDVEAQGLISKHASETKRASNISKLKMMAGALTTASGLLAMHMLSQSALDQTEHTHDRGLLDQGCSENQLEGIQQAKRALIISGATTAASLVGYLIGSCTLLGSISGTGEPTVRSALSAGAAIAVTNLSMLGTMLGPPATVASGIAYGVLKNRC